MKDERALPHVGEALGHEPGDFFGDYGATLLVHGFLVDVQDEVQGARVLFGSGSQQTGGEQRTHVVRTAPRHRATRIVNGLEVEPACGSALEVDHYVLGHRVAVSQSQAMEP